MPNVELVLRLLLALIPATDQSAPPDYASKVLPILTQYCIGCHNADDAQGGLVMDDFAQMLEGGEHGPPLVPNKPDESLFVLLVEGKKKPKMPPKDNPAPTSEEIAVLRAWVGGGAKGPDGAGAPVPLVTPKIAPVVESPRRVRALASAPMGDLVAIAVGNQVQLVNRATGYITRVHEGAIGPITAVSFSRDGNRLVSAAGEPGLFGQALLWSVEDGKQIREFRGHGDSLYAAVLNHDATLLATAGYDKDVRLWDVATGAEVGLLKGHNDAVFDLSFSPDGRFLASASGDRTIKLWSVATRERLDTFTQSLKEVYAVAFSPDGARVAAGGVDNRIRVWRLGPEGKEGTNPIVYSRFAHQSPIVRLAYSPDGQWLASAAEDRTVKLWAADSVREQVLLETQSDWPNALAFTPDSAELFVGRHDGTLSLYDRAEGKKKRDLVPTLPPPAPPELLALSRRGVQLGAENFVRLTGKNLLAVTEVKFSDGRITARFPSDPTPSETERSVQITASGLPRGKYQLSVVSPGGTSKPQDFWIDDLPQQDESEPNDRLDEANVVALPASVWGTVATQGEADHFAFEGKEGETVVFEAAARDLGSKLSAVLTVLGTDGKVLASTNDADGAAGDPVLALRLPATGRFVVRVNDLRINGSIEHQYRLSMGTFAYAAAVHPLSITANAPGEVELVGYNIPPGTKVAVPASPPGEVRVPVDENRFRVKRALTVLVGALPEVVEVEPNDGVEQATTISIPGTAAGRFLPTKSAEARPDIDFYRFEAKKGEEWVIETDAQRRGSPADTGIEVLDARGEPIERVWLQAVRDSYIEFRNINAVQAEARVKNWEEMELNELMYLRGEVCKLFRAPRGPDSGFNFYTQGGARRTYFDTTSTAHAVGDTCYIVEPHTPGTSLVPNGLPIFKIPYANDDSGDRKIGSDSRLNWTAPADGGYLVKVRDVRGLGGEGFGYRLTIRRPQPDFSVQLVGANPTVNANSAKEVRFAVDRVDGFEGAVAIDVAGLPVGFTISRPIVIEAGHSEAHAALVVAADAPDPTKETETASVVTASAQIAGATVTKPVNNLGKIARGARPKIAVKLSPADVVITPGGTVAVKMTLERDGFDGRVSFDVSNLPHGVIVDNIGLNGILIPEKQTERTFYLSCREWVGETSRPFHAVARVEGDQASGPVMLHVRRSGQLAQGQ